MLIYVHTTEHTTFPLKKSYRMRRKCTFGWQNPETHTQSPSPCDPKIASCFFSRIWRKTDGISNGTVQLVRPLLGEDHWKRILQKKPRQCHLQMALDRCCKIFRFLFHGSATVVSDFENGPNCPKTCARCQKLQLCTYPYRSRKCPAPGAEECERW